MLIRISWAVADSPIRASLLAPVGSIVEDIGHCNNPAGEQMTRSGSQ